jgi:myo-inositol-1(or 4)-monophosphatase
MTDWLAFSRACTEGVHEALRTLPTRREREPVTGAGEGGDQTTAIDAAAEEAVVTRLEALGVNAVLVSEELGVRSIGAGGPLHVVVDPIDGSVNCKRGIPYFALSVAVAEGDTMDDVRFAYVADLATGEEWTAEQGMGAFLDRRPLTEAPKGTIEILAFEGTTTSSIAERAGAMVDVAERLRVMGSLALSLCHLAAGRLDAVCSLKPARSIDIAAAQLLVRERGLAIELFEDDRRFGQAPLDLGQRSRLAAAATPELCARVAAAISP